MSVIDLDHLRKLLKACDDRTFEGYRDRAMILLFIDTGCRLSEITDLTLDDVDLDTRAIHVVGTGSKPRAPSFDEPTRTTLRRYLRARQTHALADTPWLWLGSRGRQLTPSGIAQMLRRRCQQAGIPPVHPHQFRHTYAHEWLAEGGNEGDLIRLAGWRSRDMLARCGASGADQRARELPPTGRDQLAAVTPRCSWVHGTLGERGDVDAQVEAIRAAAADGTRSSPQSSISSPTAQCMAAPSTLLSSCRAPGKCAPIA